MKEIMAPTFPLIRIRGSASLREAAQLISDLSIGALGVDGPGHEFIGLFTERDLAWSIAQGRDPEETHVEQVVNDLPIVVEGPISIEAAARKMSDAHVRHLLVKEDDDLRIVSMRNLIRDYVDSLHNGHATSTSEMRHWYTGALDSFS